MQRYNHLLVVGMVFLATLFIISGCGGSASTAFKMGQSLTKEQQQVPQTMTFQGSEKEITAAVEGVLFDMGYNPVVGLGRISCPEKSVNVGDLGMVSSLSVPNVYATVNVKIEANGGMYAVTPRANYAKAPVYNQQSREDIDMPGWEADFRKELFAQVSMKLQK